MKQFISGKSYSGTGSTSLSPVGIALRGGAWDGDAAGFLHPFKVSHPWSVAGAFKHLYVEIVHPVENPVGNGWPAIDFTLYINNVPTALTVTVPAIANQPVPPPGWATSAQNVTDAVRIAPGDRVNLVRGPGTILPGYNQFTVMFAWSLTFESDNAGESGYGVSSWGAGPLSSGGGLGDLLAAPLSGPAGFRGGVDAVNEPDGHSVVPLDGQLYRLDVEIDTPPGAGATRVFAASLNGVIQDGSGGSVDTRVTLGATDTVGVGLFALPLHLLDWLSILQLPTVGPDPAAALLTCSVGVRATTDGQSALCGFNVPGTPVTDGSTDYSGGGYGGWAWSTAAAPTPFSPSKPLRWPMSEYSMSLPGPIDACTLSHLCMNHNSVGPGAGKSYLFTTRKGFADTAAIVTMSGTDVLKLGTGTTGTYAAPSDRLSLSAVGTNGPNELQTGWAWLITSSPTPAPQLTVAKHHTDPFYQGQLGATYTIDVSNTGAANTSGLQTVTDTIPSGLTLVSMSGTGWVCVGNVCTRSDVLAPGASYPPITVIVNVAADATSPQINLANAIPDSTIIAPARVGYRYLAKVAREDRTMRVRKTP